MAGQWRERWQDNGRSKAGSNVQNELLKAETQSGPVAINGSNSQQNIDFFSLYIHRAPAGRRSGRPRAAQ